VIVLYGKSESIDARILSFVELCEVKQKGILIMYSSHGGKKETKKEKESNEMFVFCRSSNRSMETKNEKRIVPALSLSQVFSLDREYCITFSAVGVRFGHFQGLSIFLLLRPQLKRLFCDGSATDGLGHESICNCKNHKSDE